MARLAREGSHDMRVRQLALDLTKNLPGKDWEGETKAIFDYVMSSFRYVRDIRDIDTLHMADTLLDTQAGDCDDLSIILASLLLSIGHDLQFVALSPAKGEWSHVWLRDLTSDRALDLDATLELPFGKAPPLPAGAEVMTYDIDALP